MHTLLTPPDSSSGAAATLRGQDLNALAHRRVLVAGDFMLDEYLWGQVERISPEAPVVVVQVDHETRVLGGAGNVVNNLVGLGAKVEVLGLVGDDRAGADIRQEFHRLGLSAQGLLTDPERPTTRKTRVVGGNQQIVRIDREDRGPAPPWYRDALRRRLADLRDLDAVILSDYGKGALAPPVVTDLIAWGRQQRLPVVVDPKGVDYLPYRSATLITPNRREAEAAVGYPLTSRSLVEQAGTELCRRLDLEALLITQGAEGMTLFQPPAPPRHIPAQAREVFDVSGAGDTVVAVLALGLAAWRDPLRAATLANAAAGVVVGKVGTAPILRAELEAELLRQSPQPAGKIVSLAELHLLLPRHQAQGKKVVFTNGCFDLLHWGHIKFLEAARRHGDILVVALDSDASVRQVKGEGRPVIEAAQRSQMLAALAAVDYVTVFSTAELPQILADLKPNVLAKGSNYPAAQVAGGELVRASGGEVVLIPITADISVRSLINQIRGGDD